MILQFFIKKTKNYKDAIVYAKEASACFEALSKEDDKYRMFNAAAFDILGESYMNIQKLDSARIMYDYSLNIIKVLYKDDSQKWEASVIQTLANIINITGTNNQTLECESYCSEILGILKNLQETNESVKGIYKTYLELYVSLTATNRHYKEAYYAYIEFYSIIKEDYSKEPDLHKSKFAQLCGNLSYYALFLKRFSDAENYASEGIHVDSSQTFIYSNLAVSILLQGRFEEAKMIYNQYATKLRNSFLDDFEELFKAGVIPKERVNDVEKIKLILQ